MDRLTEKRRGKWVIPLRQDGKHQWFLCSAGMGDAPAKYLYGEYADRLAAYEDTGLEPEEIEDLTSVREITPEAEYAINKHADSLIERMDALLHQDDSELEAYRALGPIDHLRELVQAEKDGRLAVLPCKVGDTVYRIYDDCDLPGDCYTQRMCKGCEYRNLFIDEQAFCLSMLSQNGMLEHPYYLTREEAEAVQLDEGV